MYVVSWYGRDLNVKFSNDKRQVLVINGGEDDVERKLKLDEKDISRTNVYRYLGCVMNMRCGRKYVFFGERYIKTKKKYLVSVTISF